MKIKDAIIDGKYYQEEYRVHPELRVRLADKLILENLFSNPKEVVKNWYAEYLDKQARLAEVEDLTDEWLER